MSCQLIAFLICCQLVTLNLWLISMLFKDFDARVWWHIYIAEDKFEFEFPASCLFNIGDVAWSITFEIYALLLQ